MILVALLWPQRDWITQLLSLLVAKPLQLVLLWNLLVQPLFWKFQQGLKINFMLEVI